MAKPQGTVPACCQMHGLAVQPPVISADAKAVWVVGKGVPHFQAINMGEGMSSTTKQFNLVSKSLPGVIPFS